MAERSQRQLDYNNWCDPTYKSQIVWRDSGFLSELETYSDQNSLLTREPPETEEALYTHAYTFTQKFVNEQRHGYRSALVINTLTRLCRDWAISNASDEIIITYLAARSLEVLLSGLAQSSQQSIPRLPPIIALYVSQYALEIRHCVPQLPQASEFITSVYTKMVKRILSSYTTSTPTIDNENWLACGVNQQLLATEKLPNFVI